MSNEENNPNKNYAMYEADRVAKAKAQPQLPAVTGGLPATPSATKAKVARVDSTVEYLRRHRDTMGAAEHIAVAASHERSMTKQRANAGKLETVEALAKQLAEALKRTRKQLATGGGPKDAIEIIDTALAAWEASEENNKSCEALAKQEAVTGERNVARETIQEREYKRLYLKANAERDELLCAVLNLRKAWIAPHRFNLRQAEEKLVEVSHNLQMSED